MQFPFDANQSHFHKIGFALRLALKQRHKRSRKWPIVRSDVILSKGGMIPGTEFAVLVSSSQNNAFRSTKVETMKRNNEKHRSCK